jgi:hypothetical protein
LIVAFVLGLGVLVATALLAAACLRLVSSIAFLLAAYVIAAGELVLITELLSLGRLVRASWYLVAEIVVLAGVLLVWHRTGRPRPPLPALRLRAAARRHPVVAALALVVLAAFAYELVVGLVTPPNNGDALKYHLARAAAWLHHGGLERVPGAHTNRGVEFQPNAEIEMLYTLAFVRSGAAVTLPQLAAKAALLAAIAGMARRIGFSPAAAAFAALLGATLSQIALQAVTAKNDLVVASFVAAAGYFVLSRGATPELALAGLAMGLALGTKLTAALALPGLVVLALVSLGRRQLAILATSTLVGFLAVGGYTYVENLVERRGPLGPKPEENIFRPDVTPIGTVSTLVRVGYRFVDLSGFRVKTRWLEPLESGSERVLETVRIPPGAPESVGFPFSYTINVVADVDHSFFGPLGVLLVLPLSLAYGLAWLLRRVGPTKGALALSLPLFTLALALTFRFSDEARFFIMPVALTLPLAATLYRRRVLAAAVAVLGALTLLFAHAYNVSKPTGLAGTTPVWQMTRAEAIAVTAPGMRGVVEGVERRVPANARLGVWVAPSDWVYPLYGPELERRLVPLPGERLLGAAERRGLDWILLGKGKVPPPLGDGWSSVRLSELGTLLVRNRR